MKELKPIENVYIEELDLYVKKYLTLAQIENIAQNVAQFETWAEREKTKNLMTFIYAAGIEEDDEKANAIDYDLYQENGVFEKVNAVIANSNLIDKAIEYTCSTIRALYQLSNHLPEILKPLKDVMERHGVSTKKQ